MTHSSGKDNDFSEETSSTQGNAKNEPQTPPRCKLGWRDDRPVILCASPADRDRAMAALEDITVEVQTELDESDDQNETTTDPAEA